MLDVTPSVEKLERAQRKLERAHAMVDEWAKRGIRYNIRTEIHGNAAHLIAKIFDRPPEDVTWEVVEAVGQLRSALDKMMVALVESNGRGVSGVTFPFGGMDNNGNAEAFPTPRHEFLKKKLTDEQWQCVLEQGPHPMGNPYLWGINQIANEDKHRKNLVRVSPRLIARQLNISGGTFVASEGANFGITAGTGEFDSLLSDSDDESILLSYAFGEGSIHPKIDTDISISLAFGDVAPVKGAEILGTVSHQIDLVRNILTDFSQKF